MGQGKGKKPATYEDIDELPVGGVGEIIADELYASPRPAYGHLRVASRLGALLTLPYEMAQGGPGGWWFLDEPELHFRTHVVVPDLAGWRRERVPEPPEAETPWLTQAPDWVCEVLSPSTMVKDRVRKLPLYHLEGAAHAWVIDPLSRTLEVFRSTDDGWARAGLHEGDGSVFAEPFGDIPLELGLLWTPEYRARERQSLP
ncbi:Uma2 family endonuclease [Pyxidicoccus xibeiensis]|uniref:Uma2 family endonuclease n=1 Tax=Pyxidicoccus xibeiensis TaxID=2906759 RepID=UPI0020A6DF33|nr:Uma2 family endonuclease [Pyxidicoccus xibeiensis]MCP3142367.1 Uma2 family endonuclease [Pyxidicoccus xibeiensis]